MKKVLSTLIVVVMLIGMLPTIAIPVFANHSCPNGFNKNYTLTGNAISDMVAIATCQIGRTQSQIGYNEGWCDNFVSDCAILAGQSHAIPQGSTVGDFLNQLLKAGAYYVSTPKAGDVVIFKEGNSCTHAALMVDSVNCINGNFWSNGYSQVEKWSYSTINSSNGWSCVFVRPLYSTEAHTHNYNTYVYYWSAHPHYKCYECSCGDVKENKSEPMFLSSCTECLCSVNLHTYSNDCDTSCNICGATRSVYHNYASATCTDPKTCRDCGVTSGSKLGHSYSNNCDTSCNYCGATRSVTHDYAPANCYAPKTCRDCGVTSGSKLGHSYSNNCDASCNTCGETRSVGTHYYGATDQLIKCSYCGTTRTDTKATFYYSFYDDYSLEYITNGTFVLNSNAISREGYILAGWSVFRYWDEMWLTEEGWYSESDITRNGYTKKVYQNGDQIDVVRDGWTEYNNDKFVFYLVLEPCLSHQYTSDCDSYCDICWKYNPENGHQYDNACDSSCNVCGATYTISHTFSAYINNNDATSQKDGTKTRTCAVCKKNETVTAAGTKLQNPFKDVKANEYYTEPVLWAVSKKITNGMSETSFAPTNECTRGQIVTFLWRAAGSPEPTSTKNPFVDVKSDQYYYKAVLWAVEKGITNGMDATHFAPDATCTRGQVVTFLHRAKSKPAASGSNAFADVSAGAYYYDAVRWAVKNEITNGMGNGTFAPDTTCTRGQIVTFLYRAYN